MGDYDPSGRDLQSSGSGKNLIQRQTARSGIVMTRQLISAAQALGKKAGLTPEPVIRERCARISSWPDCNNSPLARGRIHLCRLEPSGPSNPLHGRGGPYIFCEKLAECGGIEHLLGQQLLKLGVVFFECLQALRLGHLRRIWLSSYKMLRPKSHTCGTGRPPSCLPPAPSAPQ